MLTVGVDSYCTVDEADKYIHEHFLSTSIEVETWDKLSDSDKEVYLRSSAESLNGLSFKGRKKTKGQRLAFPRINYMPPGIINMPIVYNQAADNTLIQGFGNGDGLFAVMEAQIENAIAHSIVNPKTLSDTRTRVLSGIMSEHAGSISRSYSDISNNNKTNLMLRGIYNPDKVESKLKAWLTSSLYSI